MNSIRKYRDLAGLTQQQFADELKISVMTVSRYENSDRIPRWTEIVAMCKVLSEKIDKEITPEELMSNPTLTPLKERAAGEDREAG